MNKMYNMRESYYPSIYAIIIQKLKMTMLNQLMERTKILWKAYD
jgi:hypothetical protein